MAKETLNEAELDVRMIDVDLLKPYADNPYPPYNTNQMKSFTEDIEKRGILTPLILRPIDDEKFEILSGNNRAEAARILKLKTIPAVIMENLTDEDAAEIVTSSNLGQRSIWELKYSESAKILDFRLETLKKFEGQGKRNDLFERNDRTSAENPQRLTSREVVAKEYNTTEDKVRRRIRILKLPQYLIDKVDVKKPSFTAGYHLSWLAERECLILYELIEEYKFKISVDCAKILRKKSEELDGKLTEEDIMIINGPAPEKEKWNMEFSEELAVRFTILSEKHGKPIGDLLGTCLDMIECGEVKGMFGEDE